MYNFSNSPFFCNPVCHSEERGISTRSSTKIRTLDYGVTYGDSSFLGMTKKVRIDLINQSIQTPMPRFQFH